MQNATGSGVGRREFLAGVAAAVSTAIPAFVPARALGRDGTAAPSERLAVGVVGLGSRGFNLLDEFLAQADAQVTAICDVDALHYRDRPWGQGQANGREPARALIDRHYAQAKSGSIAARVRVFSDFRELCALDDLDAVVVATPDHWHLLCALEALQHGKDVYCEKPVTHLFAEGQRLYRAVAEHNAVFQTGSQQRSEAVFRHAAELVLNGHLGAIRAVEVGISPGYDSPRDDATETTPPKSLDYDLWCGPAAKLPYLRARHHRWWRGHRAYGGGTLMDWIGHHNDIAHWALGMDGAGPRRVEAVGWVYPATPVYNTPQHYEVRCEYPGAVVTSIASRHPIGVKFIGEAGWVFAQRGKLQASDPRWAKLTFDCGPTRVYRSDNHPRNFLDCIRSRQPCVAPAETAHRSITPGHLGFVSQALGRGLEWDAAAERVVNDDEAQRLLNQIDYRPPWTAPA